MRSCQVLCGIVFFASFLALPIIQAQDHPFGSHHQTYAAGTLFPNQYSQAQIDTYVSDYYDQWKSEWIRVDPGRRRVSGRNGRIRSDDVRGARLRNGNRAPHGGSRSPTPQNVFNGLYTYARAHPSQGNPQLMDWAQPDPSGNSSAFDGDADIAYGLLVADAQWGSNGSINYRQEALNIIDAIHTSTIGPTSNLPMLGDWVDPNGGGAYNPMVNSIE